MRTRHWAVGIAVLFAGCGAPSATLKDDQTVTLTDESPIRALVVEKQPQDGYLLNIDATADQPVDFAFVGGNVTVDEAVEQRVRGKLVVPAYRQTGKAHTFEAIHAGNATAVVVIRHVRGTGPATVRVTRKIADMPPQP